MNTQLKEKFDNAVNYIYPKRYFLLTVLFLFAFCLFPLSLMATTKGHDYTFHMLRINSLAEEMQNGNWMPRIYTSIFNGNGYAAPLFYGQLFLTIPAALIAFLGVSLEDSYAFFVALIFASTVISMYFCTRSITKSEKSAFCGAVMFGLSAYLAFDLFKRGAIGEAQAFVFIPIVFAGFYHIMYGEIKKWYLLPLGLAGVLYCHTLSALMTVFVLVLFLLFSLGCIKENPNRIAYLVMSAGVFFLLGADFIFPMIEQMKTTSFLATDGYATSRWGDMAEHSMPLWTVFYDFNANLTFFENTPANSGGPVILVFTVICIIYRKQIKDKLVYKLLAMSAVLLFMISRLFPWEWDWIQSIFGILQFPWRLFVFSTFFVALAAAIWFGKKADFPQKNVLMCLIITVSMFSYFISSAPIVHQYAGIQYNDEEIKYYYENYVGAAEYLPSTDDIERNSKYDKNYVKELIANSERVTQSGVKITDYERIDGKFTVQFSGVVGDNPYIEVPLVMYNGYTATLQDGRELNCSYGYCNRIRVYLEGVQEGIITFEYTGTDIQKISRAISIAGLIILVTYLIIDDYLRKRKNA